MVFNAVNLFLILIFIWFASFLLFVLYFGYLAWLFPDKLKRKYVARTEKWPNWFPFREYYLHFYNSDNFVYLARILTICLPIGMIVVLYTFIHDW
jgi:hypothetical protein